jgi:hypothetical protein
LSSAWAGHAWNPHTAVAASKIIDFNIFIDPPCRTG